MQNRVLNKSIHHGHIARMQRVTFCPIFFMALLVVLHTTCSRVAAQENQSFSLELNFTGLPGLLPGQCDMFKLIACSNGGSEEEWTKLMQATAPDCKKIEEFAMRSVLGISVLILIYNFFS